MVNSYKVLSELFHASKFYKTVTLSGLNNEAQLWPQKLPHVQAAVAFGLSSNPEMYTGATTQFGSLGGDDKLALWHRHNTSELKFSGVVCDIWTPWHGCSSV